MKATSQIIAYLASFVVVFGLGNFFDLAYWQARFHAERLLNGKPLPAFTQFFIAHHHLPAHLALLPWLWLVGGPLLTFSAARNYFCASAFVLRYLAFISCELLLFFVLGLFLALPFIPYYAVLEPFRQSATEYFVQIAFWAFVAGIVLAGLRRARQIRKIRDA